MSHWEVVQYPSRAEPVPINPADQVEPTWFEAWVQPIQQPVLPIEYRHLLPDVFYQGEPAGFIEPTWFEAWTQPTEQPVLPVEYRHTLPWNFLVAEPAVWPTWFEAWTQPTEQPVLAIEYRYLLPSLEFFIVVFPPGMLPLLGVGR